MSGTATNAAEREILARLRGYAHLRSAERTIAYCVRFRESLSTALSARGIADSLLEQLERVRAAGAAAVEAPDLREVDKFLNRYSRRLHSVIDGTSIAQFRATLPDTAEQHPDEACALLDLCLSDSATALRRLDLVDYLITLLSTRMHNGMRSAVGDPSRLTPRLAAICETVRKHEKRDMAPVESRLREAIAELLDLEDMEMATQEIRALKSSLGKAFFLPEIVRAVVQYNISLANHFQSLLDVERAMDKEVLSALDTRQAGSRDPG